MASTLCASVGGVTEPLFLIPCIPGDLVHQRREPGAAVGQRHVPVVEFASHPGPGHRPGAAVPAQQGLLPQGPHLQGDNTQTCITDPRTIHTHDWISATSNGTALLK